METPAGRESQLTGLMSSPSIPAYQDAGTWRRDCVPRPVAGSSEFPDHNLTLGASGRISLIWVSVAT